MEWKLGGENPMSSQYCFQLTCWTHRTGRDSLGVGARWSVHTLAFYHSVCLLIRSLKNRCEPSQSLSSLQAPPLEVLIRTPVTRVIVASRGQLSHSWAAHFIAGSESLKLSALFGTSASYSVSWKSETLLSLIVADSRGTDFACLLCRM